jgi:flagellar biosynthesis component FlhA
MFLKLRILFTWLAVACAVACFFVGTFLGLPAAIACIAVGAAFAGLMYLCKQKQEEEEAKQQQSQEQAKEPDQVRDESQK